MHAVCAILSQAEKPTNYVHPYFTKQKYLEVYDNIIKPINCIAMWPHISKHPLVPPEVET